MNPKTLQVLVKHAGLFSKKPKWVTDPNWKDDEAAVNDWYDALTYGDSDYDPYANKLFYEMGDEDYYDLAKKYNLNYRTKRVDDKTAYYIDKLYELGLLSKEGRDEMLKMDRDQMLQTAYGMYDNAEVGNPDYEKIYKGFKWEDDDSDDYIDSLERTEYGKELEKLYKEISNYRPGKNAPTTRKDTGSIEDATPYQLEKWKREAKQSALLAGLKGALKYGTQAAGLGAGIGAIRGGILASMDDKTSLSDVPAFMGANGALWGLIGGLIGGVGGYSSAKKRKRNAKYRLSEKPIE